MVLQKGKSESKRSHPNTDKEKATESTVKEKTTSKSDEMQTAQTHTNKPKKTADQTATAAQKKEKKERRRAQKARLRAQKEQTTAKEKERKLREKQTRAQKKQKPEHGRTRHPRDEILAAAKEEEQALLQDFFETLDTHLCALPRKERAEMQNDYCAGLRLAHANGVPLSRALAALDPVVLGGFYARKSHLWFALDDAAKIYPLSMEHGKMNLFRLSATLKADVIPACLQLALDLTVCRFPTFAVTLKKGMFWHYLQAAKQRYQIQPDGGMPCRPMEVSHSAAPAFRVFFYQARISVEFFHILTDGTGGMLFLKALLTTYLRLCDALSPTQMEQENAKQIEILTARTNSPAHDANGDTDTAVHTHSGSHIGNDMLHAPASAAWDTRIPPDPSEFENAFSKLKRTGGAGGFGAKPAVQMNGSLAHTLPCRVLHFHLDTTHLKQRAAENHVTVTAYLLAQMFLSVRAAADALHGECAIQVPVNMRNYVPTKSVRNFSLYCGIRLPIETLRSAQDILPQIATQLREKSARKPMEEMLHATRLLVSTLRFIPLAIKAPIAKIIYGFLGDNGFSTTLSNLGVVQLPQPYADKVEHISFVLGPNAVNRATCAVCSFGSTTVLSITKTTLDPSFEDRLYQLLTDDGIPTYVEGTALMK